MSSELLASKVVIREEAPRVRTITGVPTNISAFVGVTERGPFGKTAVTSFEEFAKLFGGLTANASDLPIAVEGFFEEGGGAARKLYVSRTVHYTDPATPATKTSAAATLTLVTAALGASAGSVLGSLAEPFALVDGDTLSLDIDGGGSDVATFNAEAAEVTGGNAEPFALADGETLTFDTQDGSESVTFNTAEFSNIAAATAAEVAAVINAEAAGVSVTVAAGAVVITTDQNGTGASLSNFGGTALATLGFTGLSDTGTGDAADASAVTVAELKTLIEGDVTGVTVTDEGGQVRLTSDTTGAGSSVLVEAVSTMDTKLGFDNATHSGAAAGAVNTLKVDGKTDGAYGNLVTVTVAAATSGVASEFNLLVHEGGVLAEIFPNVTMDDSAPNFVETVVNDADSGSDLIKVTDLDAALSSPNDRPANISATSLASGDDGLVAIDDNDFVGSSVGLTGMRAFDQVNDISLLAIPGRATSAVQNAMLTYCEVTRDKTMFAVLDPPAGNSASAIVTYVKTTAALKESSEFGAIYWPRIKIANPSKSIFGSGNTIVVPPSGHICGVFARTDAAFNGAGVYEAPAGIEVGRIFAARGLETEEVNDEKKRDVVFPELVNPIHSDGGQVHIDGARTLKSTGDFPTIGERRGIIFISQSLKAGLVFGKHRKIKPSLRAQLDRVSRRFMLTQTRNGAFASDVPEEAFFLDWSAALNPPSVAFQRQVIGRLGVATAKPAEFIIVLISQDTRALDAELAEAA